MKVPDKYTREEERLEDLANYQIVDSEEEIEYDNIATLAKDICNTKIALISIVDEDRQWMKSCFGLGVNETSREISFCGHAINHDKDVFIVEDARNDERFEDNPLVTNDPNIVFYAGAVIFSHMGNPIGTLCVIDDEPKVLKETQVIALKTLAKNVMNLLELRRKNINLEKLNKELSSKNEEIEQFALRAAHDIKSPLRSIQNLLSLLNNKKSITEKKYSEIVNLVISSSENLDNLVDSLLEFSRLDKLNQNNKEFVRVDELIKNSHLITPSLDVDLKISSDFEEVKVNKAGIQFIIRNLLSNAIKYGDKERTIIKVNVSSSNNQYHFSVEDNGPGIDPAKKELMFTPFETLTIKDRFGNKGTGLGLASIKKIVNKMGGDISFSSVLNKGTTFSFQIPV